MKQPPTATQIDWSHPLAKHLVLALNGADMPSPVELVKNRKCTLSSTPPGVVTNRYGKAIDIVDVGDYIDVGGTFNDYGIQAPDEITVLCIYNSTSPEFGQSEIFIGHRTTSGNDGWSVGWGNATGTPPNVTMTMRLAVYGIASYDSAAVRVNDGPMVVAYCVKDNSTVEFYRDGEQISTTAIGVISPGTDRPIFFGASNQDGSAVANLNGEVPLIVIFNKKLTSGDIKSLSNNPYQIFKPKRIVGISRVTEDVKFNVIEKPWTKQPPAGTKANPKWLARGLNWLWHGNNPHHEVVGDTPHDSGNTVDADLAIASEGQVIRGTGQSRDTMVLSFPSPLGQAGKGQQQVTVGTYFKLLNLNDTVQTYLWSARQVTPSTAGWFIRKREDPSQGGNGNLEFFIDGAGGAGVGNWTLYNDLINFNTFTGTFDGVECWGYLNGVPGGQFFAGDPGDVIEDHAAAVVIGGQDSPLNSVESASDLALLYVFHTKLTQAEIKFLSENPWDLFEPELIHVPFNEELPKLATFDDPKPVTSMPARPPK